MGARRPALEHVEGDQLKDSSLTIKLGSGDAEESRHYTLQRVIGRGQTGVAWRASDRLNKSWVIKFVLREDYKNHSLSAEAQRVSDLTGGRISQIAFYGDPVFLRAADVPDPSQFYAIVVALVPGDSLKKYLAEQGAKIDVPVFLHFARALCELLADLAVARLCHNDLHEKNLLVSPVLDSLTRDTAVELVAIDSGSLKTEERRLELIDGWQRELETLRSVAASDRADVMERIQSLEARIDWWSRTDHQWVVCHLCSLFNHLQRNSASADVATLRFVRLLPDVLFKMDDPDPSACLTDPQQMYRELEAVWQNCEQPETPRMSSPFELMSAELIRNDGQLMALFSDEFPGIEECRGPDPVYLYGPRGCGKSTLLRSLSIKAVLRSARPEEEITKSRFAGIYVSCSSELRSRFWLMPEADYEVIEAHVVRYFTLLLIEELVDTLDVLLHWDHESSARIRFGITPDIASQICGRFRARLNLSDSGTRYAGISHFQFLRSQIRAERDLLWGQILDRSASKTRTDAQLLFDICRELSESCPFFATRQIAFLLDDYSNQRIPIGLQRKLNQAISFAKQGNPVFKVTSEYMGVDLAGIQEGREVREVNVGDRFVALADAQRWRFLDSVLNKRLAFLGYSAKATDVLQLSHIGPSVPMAEAIRDDARRVKSFHYYGLDTISDLCSGDFAMGLDLVRRICEQAKVDWKHPRPVAASVQHDVIVRYSGREHEYLRYLSPSGRRKYEIVGQLCWLARESVIHCNTAKGGKQIPLIRIHLDIADHVLIELQQKDPDNYELLQDLIHKGILFPIDTSRARENHQSTLRYQLRRILLARYVAPLGRHTPIRIDHNDLLHHLLTDPKDFVERELRTKNELFANWSPSER